MIIDPASAPATAGTSGTEHDFSAIAMTKAQAFLRRCPLRPGVQQAGFIHNRTRCTGTQAMKATAALQKAMPTIIGMALPSMRAPTQ